MKKIFESKIDLNKKLSLCYYTILFISSQINNIKDPISNLLSQVEEIYNFLKKENFTKFLYFNVDKVHNLLYLSEETILIESSENYNLSHYFYLILLINENINIVNYIYDLKYITKLKNFLFSNNEINKEQDKLKKIILSKVLIELINNYKGTNLHKKNDNDILKEYEASISKLNESLESIKNQYNISLKENIEEIYIKIITTLIINDKFEGIEHIIKIFKSLDLESIDITGNMFEKIKNILDKEEIRNKYEIIRIEQLLDIKIINFYYILLKYILKKSNYIYYIPLLYKGRLFIIQNFKKIDKSNLNENIENNLIFILNFFFDLNYYSKFISLLSTKYNSSIINENMVVDEEEMFSILTFSKIIGDHQNPVDFIKEVDNKIYISSANSEENGGSNKLFIYNACNKEKIEIAEFDNWVYNICKIDSIGNNIRILACLNSNLYLIEVSENNNPIKKEVKLESNPSISNYQFFFKLEKNKYIICSSNGAFICNNLLIQNSGNNKNINVEKIFEESFTSGIVINKNIFALTSNSININGKDLIKFYNINSKIIKEINGYSFINNQNGLEIITLNKENSYYEVLLCACKNYDNKNDKNGILLIDLKLNEENIFKEFYPTLNFQVHCFCQLKIKEKDNNIINDKNEIKLKATKYFLVGGFDNEKGEGIIKLYMITKIEESNIPKIEFITDVDYEESKEFVGFEGEITSIIQTNDNKGIIIACYDGKVYNFNFNIK